MRIRLRHTALASAFALLLLPACASARTVTTYAFSGEFDGTGSTAGQFTKGLAQLAINQSNGNVLVIDKENGGWVSQFTASGTPVLFPALGASSILTGVEGDSHVAVDNSGGPNDGDIYVIGDGDPLRAYLPDGTERGGNFPLGGLTHSCGVGVDLQGDIWVGDITDNRVIEFTPDGVRTGHSFPSPKPCHFDIDGNGNFYVIQLDKTSLFRYEAIVRKYDQEGHFLYNVSATQSTAVAVDRSTNHVFVDNNAGFFPTQIDEYDEFGSPITSFGTEDPAHSFPGLGEDRTQGGIGTSIGLAVNESTHDVYANYIGEGPAAQERVFKFSHDQIVTAPTLTTNPAEVTLTSATLKGVVNPDGVSTTSCYFQWQAVTLPFGTFRGYFNAVPCSQGQTFSGSTDNLVSANLNGLVKGRTYHFRIVSENANGVTAVGADRVFRPQGPPSLSNVIVTDVRSDSARITFDTDPNGGLTHYHVDWGTTASYGNQTPEQDAVYPSTTQAGQASVTIRGLEPDSEYHFQVVLANDLAGAADEDHVFRTYPEDSAGSDTCANSQVRQQTGAARLFDCRAYELVSAADTGGYDVQSDLIPGQEVLPASPHAVDKVLYSMHEGTIPGVEGNPTNLGLDPYVATRGPSGWRTTYVGVPANTPYGSDPFSSTPSGTDAGLSTFAFGGPGGCSPCFADGSTGIPVRLPDGSLVQGMVATGVPSPGPSAQPDGYIAKSLSEDGTHLVFGSTSRFAPGGNDSTGDVSIYDRNLVTGETRTVSLAPGAGPLPCPQGAGACHSPTDGNGIGELDISSNGSRIVLGQKTSVDGDSNPLWHLYLHSGALTESVDVTEGVSQGVVYNGMTADGTHLFFTTADQLLGADTDTSADVYEATVDPGGSVAMRLLTTNSDGNPSNSDSCTPPGTPDTWNFATGDGKCGAVGLAGGAGVAALDGTSYFVTPEQLEAGKGVAGQPNLYVSKPGDPPTFVATIDSSSVKPPPAHPQHPLVNSNLFQAAGAEAITVDQANGDIYVVQPGRISRYTLAGAPKNFTAGPGNGTNAIAAFNFDGPSAAAVAVDNAPGSPFNGDIYVASYSGENAGVSVWAPSGEKLGLLNGSGTSNGSFGEACGVSVDQSDGSVYVADYNGYLWRYQPTGSGPITDADYTVTGIHTNGINPCISAADGNGHAYASNWSDGPVKQYAISSFSVSPTGQSGTTVANLSTALATDPVTHELYVDELNQIGVFGENAKRLATVPKAGAYTNSRGVAIYAATGHLYVTSTGGENVSEFGFLQPPYKPIDHPAVVHGVSDPQTHRYGDFQVTPDGRFAVFASVLPLTPYLNRGHSEVYRYDADLGQILCASCPGTGAAASFDSTLAVNGSNLSDNGRVFFTTPEQLVLRDTNNARDAYEWSDGDVNLISTGASQFDSGMMSVTDDGRDALFFTRQVLAPQDANGAVLKVYDARSGGGFFKAPPSVPCQASDECHGPGSEPGPAPSIGTYKGTGGNVVAHKKKRKHRKHRKHRHPRGKRSHG